MTNHVPVAACSLPGVRQPVTMTGMGEVTEIGDHEALADAIISILSDKEQYQRSAELIGDSFSPQQTAVEYLKLFEQIQQGKASSIAEEPPAYEKLRAMRDSYLPKSEQ